MLNMLFSRGKKTAKFVIFPKKTAKFVIFQKKNCVIVLF